MPEQMPENTNVTSQNNQADGVTQTSDNTETRVYSQEQVNELLGRVRREEKDKIYPKLEALKAEKKDLETELEELRKKVAAQSETPNEQPEKPPEVENEVESLKEALANLKKTYMADLAKLSQAIVETKLNAAKEKVALKYGDQIIPELISGETPEEIEASAEKAHQKYLEIFSKAEAKVKEGLAFPPADGGEPARTGTSLEELLKQVDSMSPEEYAMKRDEILRNAFGG